MVQCGVTTGFQLRRRSKDDEFNERLRLVLAHPAAFRHQVL